MTLTTCLDCGTPSRRSRCVAHAAEHRAYKNAVYGDLSYRGPRRAPEPPVAPRFELAN